MRGTYSLYSIPLSYTVTCLYWLLVFLGEDFIRWEGEPVKVFFQVYLHGGISFVLLFEVLQSDRNKRITWRYCDILVLSIIIVLNSTTILIGKYVDGYCPYQFMKYASFTQLMTPLILFEVFALNSYQIHLFFLDIKHTYLRTEKEYLFELDSEKRAQR